MKNTTMMTIVIAIIVGVLVFLAGVKFQQNKRSDFGGQFFNRSGVRQGMMGSGNRYGLRPVTGEIVSSDDRTITIKTQDGSTKIVVVSDTTSIHKAEKGAQPDLTEGNTVMVMGTENSDGSVTAQIIQINPILRGSGPGRMMKNQKPDFDINRGRHIQYIRH